MGCLRFTGWNLYNLLNSRCARLKRFSELSPVMEQENNAPCRVSIKDYQCAVTIVLLQGGQDAVFRVSSFYMVLNL